uniref:Translocon-associated protein subunit delta n=1 Tax=Echinococcus granulosus TaxID=6210 RepID=A0A068WXC9_ECHGR|nr:translocon associated protein subunit delta [Echinococcus granulosus]
MDKFVNTLMMPLDDGLPRQISVFAETGDAACGCFCIVGVQHRYFLGVKIRRFKLGIIHRQILFSPRKQFSLSKVERLVKMMRYEHRLSNSIFKLSELYAVLGDKIVPVSRNLETDEFQVTFSDDHMKLPKGYYSIRFYDDVGYLHLRKAQSQGRPLDSVKPVFTVDVYHPGIWLSPLIHSETVALLAASLIGFGAVITKNKFF